MEKLLIFIKHHFSYLWKIIEFINGLIFSVLYKKRLGKILPAIFNEYTKPPFVFRSLKAIDAVPLYDMINRQDTIDMEYFRPHGLDVFSIRKQFSNRAFLMMGAFDKDQIVGYFFLRFFINRKCFVGRIIDKPYRGRGIGLVMNDIMYETAWRMKFRCQSTISKNNTAIMHAHSMNNRMVVIKELQNDYLLVEFIKDAKGKRCRAKSLKLRAEYGKQAAF